MDRQVTKRGFTLLELIISVVVIGILAGVVSPNFFKFKNEIDLESAYKLFLRELEYAQNLSVNQNEVIIDGEYLKIYYGIDIIGENKYNISEFSTQFELLRQFEQTMDLSKHDYIKFDFKEELQNIEYIIFDWRGRVIFVDYELNVLEVPPNEDFFVISSDRVNFDMPVKINPVSGKIIYE
ncbi:MAG: pilus assembly FimT family protein [Candidatus Muiribacteriota bacterium]